MLMHVLLVPREHAARGCHGRKENFLLHAKPAGRQPHRAQEPLKLNARITLAYLVDLNTTLRLTALSRDQ